MDAEDPKWQKYYIQWKANVDSPSVSCQVKKRKISGVLFIFSFRNRENSASTYSYLDFLASWGDLDTQNVQILISSHSSSQNSEGQTLLAHVDCFLISVPELQYCSLVACPTDGRKLSKQCFSAQGIMAVAHRLQQRSDSKRQSGMGGKGEDSHTYVTLFSESSTVKTFWGGEGRRSRLCLELYYYSQESILSSDSIFLNI